MPTVKAIATGDKIREYKCKHCAKDVQVPYKDWKTLPQKYKRWCPACIQRMKNLEQDFREQREHMHYGPYNFGRFGF